MESSKKSVTFNLQPKIQNLCVWNYAYREARRGKWEQTGRDRDRFHRKIIDLKDIISPILTFQHREKVFKHRFDTQ